VVSFEFQCATALAENYDFKSLLFAAILHARQDGGKDAIKLRVAFANEWEELESQRDEKIVDRSGNIVDMQ
jgi:hypothetical protein